MTEARCDSEYIQLLSYKRLSSQTEAAFADPAADGDTEFCDAAQAEINPELGVKRGLETRHLSMMSLAGIIGPGLLVGIGAALQNGGPGSLIIGFAIVGLVAFSVMNSLGEVSTANPAGSFIQHAEHYVDKAFAFSLGWTYFITWTAILSNEYNAVTGVLMFWTDALPIWVWFLILWLVFQAFQFLGVESFGEAEYWLAIAKIAGLLAFFVFSLLFMMGFVGNRQVPLGLSYWHTPGAFPNGINGLLHVFVFCSTFYTGCESVSMASAELRNPGSALPLVMRQVLLRILFVYIGTAFFLGSTVSSNDARLLSSSAQALMSPMTIALENAGLKILAVHVVNVFILITCVSAINSSLYIGSRTILYLAQNGMAPKALSMTNKRGVPANAVLATNVFGLLALMNMYAGASKAYTYIVNISGIGTCLVWAAISLISLRFRKAWIAQGYDSCQLPFRSVLYPYNQIFGIVASLTLTIVQGLPSLSPFVAVDFIDAYILLPLTFLLYIVFKKQFRTRLVRLNDADLFAGKLSDLDDIVGQHRRSI